MTDLELIVDAHHRFSSAGSGAPGAPSDLEPLLQESGVTRTVLVQPLPDATETERALEAAGQTSFVAAVAPWVDVTAPDLGAQLDALVQHPKVRGVCLPVNREEDNHWLTRDDVLAGLQLVGERGLSLDVVVEPRQIPSVQELAERLPALRIAVEHLGSPFIGKGEREPWGVFVLNLAPCNNVYMKLSGLVSLDTTPWNTQHARVFVEAVVRLFGYERMLFGSDWPTHLSAATYPEVLSLALDAAGPMTPDQRRLLTCGTAEAFYRLGATRA